MTPEMTADLISIGLRLGAALVEAAMNAIKQGDVSTLDALRLILRDPHQIALLDNALVAAELGRAERELGR
jgi:hypothetical protein